MYRCHSWIIIVDLYLSFPFNLYRYRLAHEYGNSIELTELWDRLQNEGRCCGVTGPQVSIFICICFDNILH